MAKDSRGYGSNPRSLIVHPSDKSEREHDFHPNVYAAAKITGLSPAQVHAMLAEDHSAMQGAVNHARASGKDPET